MHPLSLQLLDLLYRAGMQMVGILTLTSTIVATVLMSSSR
jgi:hypothetical protein